MSVNQYKEHKASGTTYKQEQGTCFYCFHSSLFYCSQTRSRLCEADQKTQKKLSTVLSDYKLATMASIDMRPYRQSHGSYFLDIKNRRSTKSKAKTQATMKTARNWLKVMKGGNSMAKQHWPLRTEQHGLRF